jgi:hypothetical protein
MVRDSESAAVMRMGVVIFIGASPLPL